jgi:hypothetical protein
MERMGGGWIRGGLLCILTKTSILRNGLGGFKFWTRCAVVPLLI